MKKTTSAARISRFSPGARLARFIPALIIGASLSLLAAAGALAGERDSAPPKPQTTSAPQEPATPSVEYIRVKMGKSIFLEPPEEDEPGVYVRIRDTSGSDFDLQSRVKAVLEENGYTPVRNIKKASYVLQANVLFAEEVSEAQLEQLDASDYDQSIGDVFASVATGAAVGGVVDITSGDHAKLGAGSAVGGILGLIAANQEAERQKKELADKQATKYYSAVVDIEVRQLAGGEVTRRGRADVQSEDVSASRQESLSGNEAFGSESSSQSREVDEYTVKSKWIRYHARVIGRAKGKYITMDDIRDPLIAKLSDALGGMF